MFYRSLSRRISLIFLGFFTLVSLSCFPSHPQSTFDAAGPIAREQLDLFLIIFWAGVFVFVAVEGTLLYTVLRFKRGPTQEVPPQTHGHRGLEIAWTIAPAIILAVIAVPTIQAIFSTGVNWFLRNGQSEYAFFNFDPSESVDLVSQFAWFRTRMQAKDNFYRRPGEFSGRQFDWEVDFNNPKFELMFADILLDMVQEHPLQTLEMLFVIKPINYILM